MHLNMKALSLYDLTQRLICKYFMLRLLAVIVKSVGHYFDLMLVGSALLSHLQR